MQEGYAAYMIPSLDSLQKALETLSKEDKLRYKRRAVGGGCISSASLLELENGDRYFLKENDISLLPMFETEAAALEELSQKPGPPVPRPLALGTGGNQSFLLMEYLTPGKPREDFWEVFGVELASLHLSGGEAQFGWHQNNYIGSSPQINKWEEKWIPFFREQRLRLQGDWAYSKGLIQTKLYKKLETLLEKLEQRISEPGQAEFLHGDLWSGNYYTGPEGKAWLIDPAAYYGCGEAELAMTEMFGSFPERFYRAYHSVRPIDPDYSVQKEIYNLYHYLNHLNLFGSSYYSSCASIIQRYC